MSESPRNAPAEAAAPGYHGPPHPLIRVLLVIAAASALPRLPLLDLSLILALLCVLLARLGRPQLARFRMGLTRLKWLFLAIAVLYWGFTPGEPLWDAAPGLSREGLFEGTRRMLALAALLGVVYLLLATTGIAQLAAALRQLVWPLQWLGLDRQRFALRLALTLDEVGRAGHRLRMARAAHPGSLVEAAATALRSVEQDAAHETTQVALPSLALPPVWQWLLPLALAAVLHRLPA